MSDDAPVQYDTIHELASTLAQKTAPSFRGNSIDREEIFRLYEKLGQYVPMRQEETSSLSERVKRIYPVVHHAYDLFVGTKQRDKHADERKIRAKGGWFGAKEGRLEIFDNFHYGSTYPDCAVNITFLYSSKSLLYTITRFRPAWKRHDRFYNKCTAAMYANGESVAPDECIDIRSDYFQINCLPPEEFVRTLVAGGSEPMLRQATLDHLLSLPEILGPYIDRKEQGKFTSKR